MMIDVLFATYLYTHNAYFTCCLSAVAAVVGWFTF